MSALKPRGLWLMGVVVVCAAAQACGDRSDPTGQYAEVDSAGVVIVSSQAAPAVWSVAAEPATNLGTEDGGPTEFYQIRDIAVLADGRFAVADGGSNQVRIFTADGDHVASHGRKGHGPGEYDGLSWLRVNGDSIFVYDTGNDRISVIAIDSGYARSFQLEWHHGIIVPVALLADRTVLGIVARHMVDLTGTGVVTDSALLSHYDAEGALVDSVGRFAHNQRVVHRVGNRQTTLTMPMSAFGLLAAQPDGFCYAYGFQSQIGCYDRRGRLTRIARLPEGPVPVTGGDIEKYWEQELASPNRRRVDALRRMRPVLPFPEFYPAFSDLRVDDQHRVWARTYGRPGATQTLWYVLENGHWIGSLKLDPAFELRAIHKEKLYGVWRDELGVETVRVYRIIM